MKSGLSRSHWKLNKALLALVVALFTVATAAYIYIGLNSPLGG